MRLIAHRGAAGLHRENTLAAFEAALELGCREIECDLRQDRDGEIVLLHDPDLSRMGGLEVRARDIRGGSEELGGLCPRLSVLLGMIGEEVTLHADVKQDDPPYPEHERRILRLMAARKGWKDRTTFASSVKDVLRRLRDLDPDIRLGFQPRTVALDDALRFAKEIGAESLRLRTDRVSPAWVAAAGEAGLEVYVYSVNDAKTLEEMGRLGVHRAFTNFPDFAILAGKL